MRKRARRADRRRDPGGHARRRASSACAFYDSGSRSFYSGKKAIKNVADAKGMKIRVQQSDMWVAMMQAIGANATPMPYAEVYTALKTGVVDAAENNWPSYESSRHYEAAKYLQPDRALDGARDAGVLQEGLGRAAPRRTRPIIRAAAKESVPYMRKLWDEREASARKTVEAGGRADRLRRRQEVVLRRHGAGLRQVRRRPQAAGHGEAHPGHQRRAPTRSCSDAVGQRSTATAVALVHVCWRCRGPDRHRRRRAACRCSAATC